MAGGRADEDTVDVVFTRTFRDFVRSDRLLNQGVAAPALHGVTVSAGVALVLMAALRQDLLTAVAALAVLSGVARPYWRRRRAMKLAWASSVREIHLTLTRDGVTVRGKDLYPWQDMGEIVSGRRLIALCLDPSKEMIGWLPRAVLPPDIMSRIDQWSAGRKLPRRTLFQGASLWPLIIMLAVTVDIGGVRPSWLPGTLGTGPFQPPACAGVSVARMSAVFGHQVDQPSWRVGTGDQECTWGWDGADGQLQDVVVVTEPRPDEQTYRAAQVAAVAPISFTVPLGEGFAVDTAGERTIWVLRSGRVVRVRCIPNGDQPLVPVEQLRDAALEVLAGE